MPPCSFHERDVENLSPARERCVYRCPVTVRGLAGPTFGTGTVDENDQSHQREARL
jgi:hypothetical protein